MKLKFDTNGNEKQKQVCIHWKDNEVSDIAYGGSKGSGKSYLGCSLIFGDAFTYDATHFFIARKKLHDLRKYTIPSIYEVFDHWRISSKYIRRALPAFRSIIPAFWINANDKGLD
jgi:phage terminase large subunit